MLHQHNRFFTAALRSVAFASASLVFAACSGGGGGLTPQAPSISTVPASQSTLPTSSSTVSMPAASSDQSSAVASPETTTDSASALTTGTSSGALIWKAGDGSLGRWITANTYQCGHPVNSGAMFTMNLRKSGTSCGRDQANPVSAGGSIIRLSLGRQYTWTFNYIDGTPSGASPGMGYDRDARSLIWQINPYATGTTCTQLWLDNGGYIGGPQRWDLRTCAGTVWTGSYSPREHDSFKIVVIPSETSSGYIALYRNGVRVVSRYGKTVNGSSGNPWWNFGPYKWIWESSSSRSSMTQVNATFENMTLTEQ